MKEIKLQKTIPQFLLDICSYYNAFICGSYAAFLTVKNDRNIYPSDIDIYFFEEKGYNTCKQFLINCNYMILLDSSIATTFSIPEYYPGVLQIIKPKKLFNNDTSGNITNILEHFDFTVSRIGVINSTVGIADEDFFSHYESKELVIKHISCPLNCLIRIQKYLGKGFIIKPSEYVKILDNWADKEDIYKSAIKQFVGLEPRIIAEDELYDRIKFD